MTKYIRNNETISGRLHDEMVMMDIDKGKYYSMNPVATNIWELLEKPLSVDQLSQKMIQDYEVDASTCKKDVKKFIGEMLSLSIIKEA